MINKPGAGEIGWTDLATAEPDGYTIGMINPPAFVGLAVEGNAKYALDDFQTIGNIVLDPGILVVGKDSPYKSLAEIVDASKAAPGAIVVGTSGAAGSSEHIGILILNHSAGTSFTPAFFGSTAPVRQALLGGHIPAATMNLSEALPLVRSGDIRATGRDVARALALPARCADLQGTGIYLPERPPRAGWPPPREPRPRWWRSCRRRSRPQ